jgi:hypothetical protein
MSHRFMEERAAAMASQRGEPLDCLMAHRGEVPADPLRLTIAPSHLRADHSRLPWEGRCEEFTDERRSDLEIAVEDQRELCLHVLEAAVDRRAEAAVAASTDDEDILAVWKGHR